MKIIIITASIIVIGFIAGCTKSKPDTQTITNLKTSLISEYYTNARYNAFSEKAEKEGYRQIAKLFKALATAESIHARNFENVLDEAGIDVEKTIPEFKVETTEKNLQLAIEEEIMDIDSTDPGYIEESLNSEITKANDVFSAVWEAEKTHKNLLVLIYDVLMTKAFKVNDVAKESAPSRENLATIEDLFSKTNYYVCPIDGRVFDSSNVTEKCNTCMTEKSNFIIIK
jgi:rubrerythrin